MTTRDLAKAIQSAGFTPSVRDAKELAALLASDDEATADLAERALTRIGPPLTKIARGFAPEAPPRIRARWSRAVGKLVPEPDATTYALEALNDADPKTRRNAIVALGRSKESRVEDALLALWTDDVRVEHARSLAASLGKIGGERARAKLASVVTDDPELARITSQARLMIERTIGRSDASGIDEEARPLVPVPIAFHCREGLEEILIEELGPSWKARKTGKARVVAELRGSLTEAYRARTMLNVGFPLRVDGGGRIPIEDAVARAITGDEARAIFGTWTRGAVRYRIAWKTGGHRRAVVWAIARAVAAKDASLVNDPTDTTWEVTIDDRRGSDRAPSIELYPRAFVDPRFAYRVADVPAASHPTVAAAIALVADAREEDVVWDPFVGSGTELVERALLGPYASLVGTDVEQDALKAARANFKAANVKGAVLVQADARDYTPQRAPTLILTNPPMGRRLMRGENLGALLDRILDRAAELLAPSGRLVWLSPIATHTKKHAALRGLVLDYTAEVDMGGFPAEIQRFVKSSGGREKIRKR